MGVVKHQSIRSTILIYLGFVVGGVNTVLLFPHFFDGDQYGLTRIIFEIAYIMVPFCTFSTNTMMNKFFPYFSSNLPDKKNDLLTWVLLTSILGYSLFVVGTFVFKGLIIKGYEDSSPLFLDHFYLLYPAVLGMVLYTILESYSWAKHATIISNFLKELGVRLFTTFLIVLYILKLINYEVFMWLFSLSYLFAAALLIFYLRRENLLFITFEVSNVFRRLFKKIRVYSLTIMSAAFFVVVANNVDSLIIASIGGLPQAAYLSIATYMSTLILVPQRSIAAIATPVIAQSWRDKRLDKIDEIYKKSALLQLIAALFIFLGIWLNIDSFYKILPPEYAAAKYVVLYLGIARVIDMGTGTNQQLLSTSRYWKFDLTSSTILIAISLPLNYFLIRKYGLVGSGYALLISMSIFNTIRCLFIWKVFGLLPFSFNTIKALLIGIGVYFICEFLIPDLNNPILDIAVSGILFTVLFVAGMLMFRVSGDINSTVYTTLQKIISSIRKNKN